MIKLVQARVVVCDGCGHVSAASIRLQWDNLIRPPSQVDSDDATARHEAERQDCFYQVGKADLCAGCAGALAAEVR